MTAEPPAGGARLASSPGATEDPGPLRPLAEVVEGYVNLAAWLTREIGGHARAIATRLEDGDYSPDLAVRDAARSAALVGAASIRIVNEAADALVLLARPPQPNVVEVPATLPRRFRVPCTLALERPLTTKTDPPHLIDDRRVTLSPNPLPAGAADFVVTVDATRRPGLIYRGRVVATPARGRADPQAVDVRV
ncbi:MAG: hypothetical protein ACREF4_08275, partial [Gammaproteobacteria bacterium]